MLPSHNKRHYKYKTRVVIGKLVWKKYLKINTAFEVLESPITILLHII